MAGGKARTERKVFLGVRDGVIEAVQPWRPALAKECKSLIDGDGQVCLPGFVNGHSHLPMTLFRGLEDDVPFHVWLFERILPLEGKLVSAAFVRDGTALAALECIRFGVTTVNEMYFFAEETAKVLDQAGMRAIVSQTMADFPLPEDSALGSDKFALVDRLREKYRDHPRITPGLAPHAPYSCGDDLLRRVAAYSEEHRLPIHIHVSETRREVEESVHRYGMSPVERLAKLGVLGPRCLCAHCVHLDESDRAIFRESGASVIHNPDSNMKLGSGVAPVADYLRRGIPVAFGTDGAASNNDLSLFGAMDIGTKLQKLAAGDSAAFTAEQALVAATWGGARALGLGDLVGSLEPGKRADFLLLNLRHPHLQPVHEPVSHLVYAAQGLEVETVVCDGRVLFANGRHLTLAAPAIYRRAEAWRKKIQSTLSRVKK
jgi:5-methylthioadenosine/S-adenosylhomocysteine deaminase